MPASATASADQRLGQWLVGRSVEDVLLAVADEAGLHEQLDVIVAVGAGDMETGGSALGAVSE